MTIARVYAVRVVPLCNCSSCRVIWTRKVAAPQQGLKHAEERTMMGHLTVTAPHRVFNNNGLYHAQPRRCMHACMLATETTTAPGSRTLLLMEETQVDYKHNMLIMPEQCCYVLSRKAA